MIKRISLFLTGAALMTGFVLLSSAQSQSQGQSQFQVQSAADTASPLVVAELFTSQSCSSCPAAEKLFSKLADRDNILTIEWHVDYWDQLVHHGSRWKDLYSQAEFTERQRAYNRSLRGTNGVYTPQAIVNGHFETVGSRPNDVDDLLSAAPALSIPVSISGDTVTVGAGDETADILFVRLLKEHVTDVKGGENKGRVLSGKYIALDAIVLGQTGAKSVELKLPDVDSGESCAVLVQSLDGNVGQVLGAARC